ncbi:MAG: hypothetical protein OZSIB_0918 [Candidatus Ozemobacter sibiricus]|jgi:hypothetical protein|uniref:Importin N-terminal domain-containing protein n=1 Tax=Candidatus Ozemobacter sibiricus TaxID=2268124 RepID=A0A367ZUF8_9BACT|nr:MAG: hypothetical protein OZSIB_0918 [Candidatus Ozemobacter sibiricus]
MARRLMFVLVILLVTPAWATASFWYPIDGPEARRVLVPGSPPLTVGQQNAFLNCLEFGLAIALTQREQEAARAALMEEYLAHRGDLLAALEEIRKIWQQVEAAKPQDRGVLRQIIRDSLLEETQKFPNLAMARVVRRILQDGNEAVLEGPPRIDRRMLAAFFELVEMALRLRDQRVIVWDEPTRRAMEAKILQRIPTLSPEGRMWLVNADFHRALIARNWQNVPPDEKETIRRFLVETFAPGAELGERAVDLERIPLPPPTIFPLPTDLPWEFRK